MSEVNPTVVVNLMAAEFDVYIGRKNTFKSLPESPFANPFPIGKGVTRAESIAKFTEYLKERPELMARAKAELQGKRLGCWCHPKDCHGDVLARLVNTGTLEEKKPGSVQMALYFLSQDQNISEN